MKAYRVRKIGAGSVFKFNLCAGFVIALVTSAVLLVIGYSLQDLGLELGTFEGVLGAGAGVVGAILVSVVYGLAAGAAGAVAAFVYNVFAAAMGGIAIKLDDPE
ncbi:MAG: hypothetical protein ACM3XS_02205 [Bacteroidota bacterium]